MINFSNNNILLLAEREFYFLFLKLFNNCLKLNSIQTFKALLRLMIVNYDESRANKTTGQLDEDPRIIGLFLRKFTSKHISYQNKERFLQELRYLMHSDSNIQVLLDAHHILHFLNELINIDYQALHSEEGFTLNAEKDIVMLIQKILRKFINFALYTEQRIFKLLTLFELNNTTTKDSASSTLFASNFFKLMRTIEEVLTATKKRIFESPQTGSARFEETKTDLKHQARDVNSKQAMMGNIAMLVFYYEYIISKLGKNIEQDEVKICQFTLRLFDFTSKLNMLHFDGPNLKSAPFELQPSSYIKRFEGICFRNGGILLSMMTIICTVLKHIKMKDHKLSLLNCCWLLLTLDKSQRKETITNLMPPPHGKQASSKNTASSTHALKQLITTSNTMYSSTISKFGATGLIEYAPNNKGEELLLARVQSTILCFANDGFFCCLIGQRVYI